MKLKQIALIAMVPMVVTPLAANEEHVVVLNKTISGTKYTFSVRTDNVGTTTRCIGSEIDTYELTALCLRRHGSILGIKIKKLGDK